MRNYSVHMTAKNLDFYFSVPTKIGKISDNPGFTAFLQEEVATLSNRICKTSFIEGLTEGMLLVQISPNLNIELISFKKHASLISSSKASMIGLPSSWWFHAHCARFICSSLFIGSLPVTSSNNTTPKLQTSLLTFTFDVYAYS